MAPRDRTADDGLGRALGALAVGWFLTLGARFLPPAILPQIRATFGIGDATAGVAISAIWVGYGLMQFPAGALADRVDERTLLSLSLVLAGASLAAIAGAPAFGVFLVACVLFGLGTGLFGPPRGIALSNLFAPTPGRAFGITLAAGSVGSAALPFVASVLTDRIGWRLAVGLLVPAFLGVAAATLRYVPADTGSGSDDGDDAASLRRTLGRALTDRQVLTAVAALTLMLFTFQALTAFLPTYLIRAKGVGQGVAGALFGVLFVAGAAAQLAGGDAVDRYGTRAVMVAVAVATALSLAALPLVGGLVPVAAVVVLLATQMAVQPVMNSYIIEALPPAGTGTAWGFLRTAFFLLGATGSTVVGVLSERGLLDESFYLLAGVTAVAVLLFVLLPAES
ncbi:MFS transporter [Halostella litorea]|uniref:MFS transporter n=1 Tax=Halostella litorea TaxID=2528831 RepID=UPI001386EACC|nr:MFS transporter [Halostella litorea]